MCCSLSPPTRSGRTWTGGSGRAPSVSPGLRASTSLTECNTTPFLAAAGRITVAPERGTTPPTATPSATPSASATAATGGSTPTTTTGALASTGSSSATWYAAAALALIAAGGVLTAVRLRRR
ncbi:LPXTG cell wall anchor domain-containing protein [Streptomyces sp. NPDC020681]|uniref:LPXTG cell wall anchor domain-containing protein n=1 Tax=Streptomyces sp. NPDC020681 TaxID=3365083 RepID=UPI00378C0EB5